MILYTVKGNPQVQLTSDLPSLVGNLCPTDVVVLTCRAEDVHHLRWYLNESDYCVYAHGPNDKFPLSPADCDLPAGMKVLITDYSPNPTDSDLMTVNSTFNVSISNLVSMGVINIKCGSYQHMSNVVNVSISQGT